MSVSTLDIIDRYCRAWSEPEPALRAELLHSLWQDGASYTDPNVHLQGAEALLAHIAKVQAGRPGAKVLRSTALQEHHGMAMFGFRVVGADGAALREGTDVAFMSADGARIARVIGFF
jgi:hypothetical protein